MISPFKLLKKPPTCSHVGSRVLIRIFRGFLAASLFSTAVFSPSLAEEQSPEWQLTSYEDGIGLKNLAYYELDFLSSGQAGIGFSCVTNGVIMTISFGIDLALRGELVSGTPVYYALDGGAVKEAKTFSNDSTNLFLLDTNEVLALAERMKSASRIQVEATSTAPVRAYLDIEFDGADEAISLFLKACRKARGRP